MLGVLGFFPADIHFEYVELSQKCEVQELSDRIKNIINKYKILVNSDAHLLENISEPVNSIDLEKIEDIYDYLGIGI